MCLETSLAWPIPPVNVFKFVMGVILFKMNCKWMLKKRWSCYLLFWVKTVEVLTWLDGWKKILVNFWYARDTHWLIKSLLLVGVNTVVLSDWVVGETREKLKWPRAWLKAMRWCEKISRFRSGMLFEFERQFVCPLHVVSRISSADAMMGIQYKNSND